MPKKHVINKVKKNNGDVCLKPSNNEFDPFATYCGELEINGEVYRPTNEDLTCAICQHTFDVLKHGITIAKI